MLEGSTKPCPMCQGTGMVRSVESVALDILRSIEDRLITDGVMPLVATTAVDVALYILNQKRGHLNDIQQRYQAPITVAADEDMHISQFVIERAAEGEIANGMGTVVHMDWAHHQDATQPQAAIASPQTDTETESEQARHRSRRRRRRGRRPEGAEAQRPMPAEATEPDDEREETVALEEQREENKSAEARDDGGAPGRKGPRRRGRRGGRRGRPGQRPQLQGEESAGEALAEPQPRDDAASDAEGRQNGSGRKQRQGEEVPKPQHREAERVLETVTSEERSSAPEPRPENEPQAPRRRGWWSRGS
jgi:ribonuclease E